MKVAECMSQDIETVTPEQSIREAAQQMLEADVGALPVVEGESLAGMITDRDIAVRAVAEGMGPETPVREVMSDEVISVTEEQDVEEAALLMSERQVRRLPVTGGDGNQIIGMIALADITRSDDAATAQFALDAVTEPGGEHSQSAEA